jgi:hypothetical protein
MGWKCAGVFSLVLMATSTEPVDGAPPHLLPSAQSGREGCDLRSEPVPAPKVHADLLAVTQYFHAGYRGGFDADRSNTTSERAYATTIFPWFDLEDLETPTLPPRGVRIAMSTRNVFFAFRRVGPCCGEELGILRRGESRLRWSRLRLYPDTAIEARSGEVWAITRGDIDPRRLVSPMHLVHLKSDGRIEHRPLHISDHARVAEIALTADDRPALVLFKREAGHLLLLLSWTLDPSKTILLDEVEVPVPVAKLSEWTGVAIAVAANGERGLAVGWRPLTGKTSDGSWTHPAAAEVRWLTIQPDTPPTQPHRYATRAVPLGGGSGPGPRGLAGNGLTASVVDGQGFFAWNEGENVVGARSGDEAPMLIASGGARRDPLIGLRPREDGLQVLLFDRTPRVVAFRVRCK